jgi:hypothetical protein
MYHTRHSTKFDSKVNSNTCRDRWINLLATCGLSDYATSSRCNARGYTHVHRALGFAKVAAALVQYLSGRAERVKATVAGD